MNAKTWVLTAAMIGMALVTSISLSLMAPIRQAEEGHPEGISVESVFSSSITKVSPQAVELAQAELPDAPVAAATSSDDPHSDDLASVASGGSCIRVQSTAASMPAAGEPAAAVGPANEDSGTDSQSQPTTPSEGDTSTGADSMTADASSAMAPADTEVADGDAMESPALGQEQAGVDSTDTPEPAAAAPPEATSAPAAPTESETATAPEPPPAGSAPKPAPRPRPAPVAPAKPQPKAPPKLHTAPLDLKAAWWPPAQSGKLNLVYAGGASFTKAIALLFDGEFANPDSANAHIKVRTPSGKAVNGRWQVAANPKMLLFSADPGFYTVVVGEGLQDKNERAISASSAGPVFIP